MFYGLWFMVYGLWFMVCGLCFMVYVLWFMFYGLWFYGFMFDVLWFMFFHSSFRKKDNIRILWSREERFKCPLFMSQGLGEYCELFVEVNIKVSFLI